MQRFDFTEIDEIKDKNSSKENVLKFWSNIFAQHFYFMHKIITSNNVSFSLADGLINLDTLVDMAKRWIEMADTADTANITKLQKLIQDTFYVKTEVKKFFSHLAIHNKKFSCFVNLLTHMLEELEYFHDCLVKQKWSYFRELEWWATEHAENLEFVNCQLPKLLQLHKINLDAIAMTPTIIKLVVRNNKLIKKFKTIAGAAANTVSTVSAGASAREYEKYLINDMIATKIEHVNAIKNLISLLPKLPLENADRVLVKEMLEHELNEAEWAFHRIEK